MHYSLDVSTEIVTILVLSWQLFHQSVTVKHIQAMTHVTADIGSDHVTEMHSVTFYGPPKRLWMFTTTLHADFICQEQHSHPFLHVSVSRRNVGMSICEGKINLPEFGKLLKEIVLRHSLDTEELSERQNGDPDENERGRCRCLVATCRGNSV